MLKFILIAIFSFFTGYITRSFFEKRNKLKNYKRNLK